MRNCCRQRGIKFCFWGKILQKLFNLTLERLFVHFWHFRKDSFDPGIGNERDGTLPVPRDAKSVGTDRDSCPTGQFLKSRHILFE